MVQSLQPPACKLRLDLYPSAIALATSRGLDWLVSNSRTLDAPKDRREAESETQINSASRFSRRWSPRYPLAQSLPLRIEGSHLRTAT